MKIRNVRWIAVGVFMLFVLLNMFSTKWYVRDFERFSAIQHLVAEASRNITVLLELEQDTLIKPSARIDQQWRAAHADLLQILEQLNLEMSQPQRTDNRVPELIELTKSLQAQYEATSKPNPNFDPELDQLRREDLYDQFKIEIHRIHDEVYNFAETIMEQRETLVSRQITHEWILSFIQMALVVLGMLYINLRIIKPVEKITRTAEQQERGDTQARSALQSDDEVGELSRRFDAMTEALQKRQISLELAQSETALLYNTLNKHSIVSIADRYGNITHANDAFCHISGYSREELLGQDHRIVNSGMQSDAFWVDFWGTINRNEAWRGEICNRTKSGDLYWVDSIVAPLSTKDGKVEKIISIRNDISPRKSMEQELRQVNGLLEQRVAERTRELEHALHVAEAADRSRRDFIANTTHELRTPMNSVLGMTYLALKGSLDPVQRSYLEKIKVSGAYLNRIIDDILDFSKMDAGKLEIVQSSFQVDAVIDFVVRQGEASANAKGLSIAMQVDDRLSESLLGDGMRIGQILLNFVSNAIKFTERGRIQVRARQQARDADGVAIRFEVEDSGMGIGAAQIDKLFSPFEQVDSSITRKFGGTGLGLAISRQLAQLMQGEVGVSSEPGQGSTFWLDLKLALADEAASEQAHGLPPQVSIDVLRGAAILVVDDNEFNLDVARGILQDAGVTVATATNGLEAIDALRKSRFACVLMDVQMPILDGLTATQHIRADRDLADTLVIGLTANASGVDRDHCIRAGMAEVIKKPIDPEQMLLTLAHWLQSNHATPDSAAAPASSAPAPADRPDAHDRLAPAAPAVDPQQALPLWDREALQKVVGDNPHVRDRLLKKYIATAADSVQELMRAIHEERWDDASATGHKLKSSSRAVGALRLGAICETLEKCAKSDDKTQYPHLGSQIAKDYAAVQALIEAELAPG